MQASITEPASHPHRQHFLVRSAVWLMVWIIVAFLFASQQVASRPFIDGQTVTWSKAVQLPLILSAYWGSISIIIFKLIERFPLERRSWLTWSAIHLLFSVLLSVIFISLCVTVMYVVASQAEYADTYTSENQWELTWWNMFWAFFRITFHSSMLIYFALLAVGQTLSFNRKLRERERLTAKLNMDLVSAQFAQLRAQLHPHFLFNTLSAITTFIDTDPQTAKKLINRLSDLLRVVVDQPSVKTRSVAEELDFLHKYIEIQSARFGSRLNFREDIAPETLPIQIPFLLLQPLVENALKYGVGESSATCQVHLAIALRGDRIQISISDTGPGLGPSPLVEGVGIRNTKSRLMHLYGEEHSFEIESQSSGFRVRISLPAEPLEDEL